MGQLALGRTLPAARGSGGSFPASPQVRMQAGAAGAGGAKPRVGPWHSPCPCLPLGSSQDGFGSITLFPWNLPPRFPFFILSGSIWFHLSPVRCWSLRRGVAGAVPAIATAIPHRSPCPPCSPPCPLSGRKGHPGVQTPAPPHPRGALGQPAPGIAPSPQLPSSCQSRERPEPQAPLIADV